MSAIVPASRPAVPRPPAGRAGRVAESSGPELRGPARKFLPKLSTPIEIDPSKGRSAAGWEDQPLLFRGGAMPRAGATERPEPGPCAPVLSNRKLSWGRGRIEGEVLRATESRGEGNPSPQGPESPCKNKRCVAGRGRVGWPRASRSIWLLRPVDSQKRTNIHPERSPCYSLTVTLAIGVDSKWESIEIRRIIYD